MNCPQWHDVFSGTQDPQMDWPAGFQYLEDRLVFETRICVPMSLQNMVIHDHHRFLGHVGL